VIFRNRKAGAVVGVALLAAGWLVLHDAYSKRNVKMPMPLRPFYPWG